MHHGGATVHASIACVTQVVHGFLGTNGALTAQTVPIPVITGANRGTTVLHQGSTGLTPGHTGVTVYLAPLDSLPPGYLAPHPGYLHPRGASCPGRFILPPANTSKNICMLFCYFYVSF